MLFKTISKSNQVEIVEKSSKFIAFAYSIQSTEFIPNRDIYVMPTDLDSIKIIIEWSMMASLQEQQESQSLDK